MRAKYFYPFTNFGFKKIFGEEASKPLLIDFLNAILPNDQKINDLSLKNTGQIELIKTHRKPVYDIYCENQKGEKFIVELQKAEQNYFKDRINYYSTFPIHEQAEKGEWSYNLQVYCIGILNFVFKDYDNENERNEVVHTIKLDNQHGRTCYDKLTYIYIEIPNFKKTESEINSRLDQWLFFIKHLEDFQDIPIIFKDEVFIKAFAKAEFTKFGQGELDSYEYSLKTFRDNKATYDYAVETAFVEGEAKTNIKVAKQLKDLGVDTDIIVASTGLTKDDIDKM